MSRDVWDKKESFVREALTVGPFIVRSGARHNPTANSSRYNTPPQKKHPDMTIHKLNGHEVGTSRLYESLVELGIPCTKC